MHANSRRYLPNIQAALPDGLDLFRSNIGDFAICDSEKPSSAIAFLRLIRPSHRALRFDGSIGRAVLPADAAVGARKTLLASATLTHILNVDELRAADLLDDEAVDGGIARFLSALTGVFSKLRKGEDLRGMRTSPNKGVYIAPLSKA